uniref:non-specific serine/threonine protein kinase n=1 Tax=Aureoumbra lagunensis TaxID=44058 RepID=A0A7S3JP39_9STRA|mmetsp:Transcript_817/g.1036  ORF Transcript_817/g.1036 Transcript_817/m.1036 type:complete len:534 (+) Transcript_817:87-1688(+)
MASISHDESQSGLLYEDQLHGDKGLRMCFSRVVPLLCGCFRIQKRENYRNDPTEYEHFETVTNPVQQGQPYTENFVEIPNHRLTPAEDEAFGADEDASRRLSPPTQEEKNIDKTSNNGSIIRQDKENEENTPSSVDIEMNQSTPDEIQKKQLEEQVGRRIMVEDDVDMLNNNYDNDDNEEPPEDYVYGGYHTVNIGDVYDNRYTVIKKLGWGVYSTVWLCHDSKSNQKAALKIQKSAPEYTNAAMNEVKILKHIQHQAQVDNIHVDVVSILEHFYVTGMHGNHVCMVFEPLGKTLLDLIQDQGALPILQVKRIIFCLLQSLKFIHDRIGILHTDIKPENILLGMSPRNQNCTTGGNGFVKLVDFGTAFYLKEQSVHDIQTREYRCPEAIIGIYPFLAVADVWSVGCLAFELLSGETLFDPQSPRPGIEAFTKDESHLAQAIELFGNIPSDLIRRGMHSRKWFHQDVNKLRHIEVRPSQNPIQSISLVLESNFGFEHASALDTAHFLLALLEYDPYKRPSAATALTLPWLQHIF